MTAVVGTLMFALLMQLIGILPGLSGTQPYLLSTQLQAWQGFFRVPTDWLPIVRGLWVSAAYALPGPQSRSQWHCGGASGVRGYGCRSWCGPRR